ncbi:MAG: hypothetical protein MJZ68_07125 [archaeon]|nr:hypothetical protein [archaeon]
MSEELISLDESVLLTKNNALSAILKDLTNEILYSSDTNRMSEYSKRFSEIYCGGYRHRYSDIYPLLLSINSEQGEISEMLVENLNALSNYLKESHSDSMTEDYVELYANLYKLSDHVLIERQRLLEMESINSRLQSNIQKLDSCEDSLK